MGTFIIFNISHHSTQILNKNITEQLCFLLMKNIYGPYMDKNHLNIIYMLLLIFVKLRNLLGFLNGNFLSKA